MREKKQNSEISGKADKAVPSDKKKSESKVGKIMGMIREKTLGKSSKKTSEKAVKPSATSTGDSRISSRSSKPRNSRSIDSSIANVSADSNSIVNDSHRHKGNSRSSDTRSNDSRSSRSSDTRSNDTRSNDSRSSRSSDTRSNDTRSNDSRSSRSSDTRSNDTRSTNIRSARSNDSRNNSRNNKNRNTNHPRGNKDKGSRHIPESLRQYVVGIIDMKATGKAYLLPEDKEISDVFIDANNTRRALGGDKVRVLLFPRRDSKGKLEGQVAEILQRNKNYIVGIIEKSGNFYFLLPDNPSVPVDIFISEESLGGAKIGDKVMAKIVDWPIRLNNPIGEVVRVLGTPGENNVEMQSILAEYNFPLDYPQEALNEAKKMSEKVTDQELKKRRDFRQVYTCTIDPADAKDFDDALSFQMLPNGNVEVGVHIADVSYFVKPGSAIDGEAYSRGTSVYLVDRTVAMLPERLCNDLCSLKPDVDRFTFSAVFEMNPETAEIYNAWFGKGLIHSDRRFTYEEAQEIIESKSTGKSKELEAINMLFKMSQILKEERYQRGAINFHSQEVRFRLDPTTAKPLSVYIKEQKEANFLVEEFMLLANRKVAEIIGKEKKSFVYRVHDEPNPEKLTKFVDFVQKLGYKMNIQSRSGLVKSFNKLLSDVVGKAEQNMIETISVRTMAKACYTTNNIGHYGLSFKYYTHFTSPIRRYPDLMVHRLLEYYLNKGKSVDAAELETKCEHSSDMEKKASDAERASIKYKQAEFLADKVGESFYGLISGVSKWGMYVALEENYCEGMVPLRNLKDDFYELDEENYRVIGTRTGQIYKLGDRVKIRVVEVDLNKKQMTFSF